ncbi:MAG TPA: transcriptional regulator NanR [Acetobacteraceae bacterium]|nr:transcriptional regulator NanR [Acetobacteraceae bacterium]
MAANTAAASRPGLDASPGPIRRRKLYEEVVARIEAMIHSGEYAPGDQLPSEREIMEAYAVGRTSVREALFALQKMGLVTINSGERARVTLPTAATLVGELSGAVRHMLAQPTGIEQFQQARALFETALARWAAKQATVEQIAALERALAANKNAIGQHIRFERTDVAFHYVLAEMPGNPIFTALHAAMADWLFEQRTTSIRAAGSERAAYRAHKRIFDAIAARDPDAAETAMQEHLDEVARYYWQVRKR